MFGNNRTYKDFFDNLESYDNGKLKLGKNIKDRTLSNRLTELTKLAQKYLVMKNLESNKFKFEISLLEELNKRNINNYFVKRVGALQNDLRIREINIQKVMDLTDFYRFKRNNDTDEKNNEDPYDYFHDTIDMSSVLFVIEYLKYRIWDIIQQQYCNLDTVKFTNALTEQIDFEKVISYLKSNSSEFFPLVSFYYYLFKAFVNTNETYNYHIARKIFINDLKSESKKNNNFYYNYLIEYNIYKNNLEKKFSSNELFLLINMKIESGIFAEEFENENSSIFMVSIMNALALDKFEWVENFIEKYGKFLPDNVRVNKINLSMAFLNFFKKDFIACEKYSEMVEKTDPFFYVNSTKLKLQSCFELNKLEECYFILKRFNEYLRNHKNSANQLIKYAAEFSSGFTLLLKLKDKPTEKNFEKIAFEIKNKNLDLGIWMNSKISEFELKCLKT